MGTNLFGVDIAGEIAKAFPTGSLPQGRLTRTIAGTRDAADPTGGARDSERVHTMRGFREALERRYLADDRVRITDAQVLIIGDSLPEGVIPGPGDRLEIDGLRGAVVALLAVDPARATFVVAVR
jgi:hypothetical protein